MINSWQFPFVLVAFMMLVFAGISFLLPTNWRYRNELLAYRFIALLVGLGTMALVWVSNGR